MPTYCFIAYPINLHCYVWKIERNLLCIQEDTINSNTINSNTIYNKYMHVWISSINPTLAYLPSNTPKPSVTILLSLSLHRNV